MLEIATGLICFIAGLGLGLGLTAGLMPSSGFEFAAGAVCAGLGSLLLAHGLFRRVRDARAGDTHGLRTQGLMLATALAAVLLIAGGIGIFSRMTISGIPVGFHVFAVVLPLALFMLMLVFNRKQSAIDLEAAQRPSDRETSLHGV